MQSIIIILTTQHDTVQNDTGNTIYDQEKCGVEVNNNDRDKGKDGRSQAWCLAMLQLCLYKLFKMYVLLAVLHSLL